MGFLVVLLVVWPSYVMAISNAEKGLITFGVELGFLFLTLGCTYGGLLIILGDRQCHRARILLACCSVALAIPVLARFLASLL